MYPRLELAPMEGITNYIYRNALAKYYGGIDEYFSPFVSTHKNQKLNYKELNDLLPEHNEGIVLVPQVLTACAQDFFNTVSQIEELGYKRINLNFGCPSPTVTTKGKGAGILLEPAKLEDLLDKIFEGCHLKISIKTRIGFYDASEWPALLNIYAKFPIDELIIHARVREDFYKNKPTASAFVDALALLSEKSIRLTYNGNIFSIEDYVAYEKSFYSSSIGALESDNCGHSYMLGRGIIANPALAKQIKSATGGNFFIEADLDNFKAFNLELMNKYCEIMSGDRNVLFKLKELWSYMGNLFPDNPKLVKSIKKCNSCREYESIIRALH